MRPEHPCSKHDYPPRGFGVSSPDVDPAYRFHCFHLASQAQLESTLPLNPTMPQALYSEYEISTVLRFLLILTSPIYTPKRIQKSRHSTS